MAIQIDQPVFNKFLEFAREQTDSNAIARPGPRLKDAAIELYNFLNGAEEEVPAA